VRQPLLGLLLKCSVPCPHYTVAGCSAFS
jgi:hypothetical protein